MTIYSLLGRRSGRTFLCHGEASPVDAEENTLIAQRPDSGALAGLAKRFRDAPPSQGPLPPRWDLRLAQKAQELRGAADQADGTGDAQEVVFAQASFQKEQEFADAVSQRMNDALQDALTVDLAARTDRRRLGEVVPINSTDMESLEEEEKWSGAAPP